MWDLWLWVDHRRGAAWAELSCRRAFVDGSAFESEIIGGERAGQVDFVGFAHQQIVSFIYKERIRKQRIKVKLFRDIHKIYVRVNHVQC